VAPRLYRHENTATTHDTPGSLSVKNESFRGDGVEAPRSAVAHGLLERLRTPAFAPGPTGSLTRTA